MRICSADEVGLHVEDPSLRVHQVLLFFTLNVNHAHDNSINHVDGLTLVCCVLSIHLLSGSRIYIIVLLDIFTDVCTDFEILRTLLLLELARLRLLAILLVSIISV